MLFETVYWRLEIALIISMLTKNTYLFQFLHYILQIETQWFKSK